jgi:hypothetical protein
MIDKPQGGGSGAPFRNGQPTLQDVLDELLAAGLVEIEGMRDGRPVTWPPTRRIKCTYPNPRRLPNEDRALREHFHRRLIAEPTWQSMLAPCCDVGHQLKIAHVVEAVRSEGLPTQAICAPSRSQHRQAAS